MRRHIFEFGASLSGLLAMMLVVMAVDGHPLQGWVVHYLAALGTVSVVLMTVGSGGDRDE